MTFIRSIVFNATFYVMSFVMVVVTLPVFAFAAEKASHRICVTWASIGLFLLRTIVGTRLEVRGIENIPTGGAIIAPKHQSMFETFALFPILNSPSYVMKQELARIPLWGWYAKRAGMIMLQRDQRARALRGLAVGVRAALKKDRQVVIFPEGTRRPPGAKIEYLGGIAHLYRITGAPVVPVALNSGLFWPRRQFVRHPGTIIIEFLPPIPPGLNTKDFNDRLQREIETASDRLLLETSESDPSPPFPPIAKARLDQIRHA